MPTFFFHLRDGGELIEDPDGSDLPDLDAARAEAIAGAREAVAEGVRAGKPVLGRSVEIADGAGRVLATVTARDVLGPD